MRRENLTLSPAACEALLDQGLGKQVRAAGIKAGGVPIQSITVTFVSPDGPKAGGGRG